MDDCCGQLGSYCTCHDCMVYDNPNTIRPIKSPQISDDKFNEIIRLCKDDTVIQIMKKERYRAIIYQATPYQRWDSLNDEQNYQNIVDELKAINVIPNEIPEICFIEYAIEYTDQDNPINFVRVCYRFQTSTVKYELHIYEDVNGKSFKTHSRGTEFTKK
jgi:hypothetical protein